MPEIADDEPLSVEALSGYQRAGRAWIAVDQADRPVAYLIGDHVDGNVHIEQLTVDPDYARRGVGRSPLEHVADRARADRVAALTLTAFADVVWNAPYYLRCGFRVLHEREWTPGWRRSGGGKPTHGLDRWPRVCMRRDL